VKRILDCGSNDFRGMNSTELAESFGMSEGRTLLCEVLWPAPPLIDGVTKYLERVAHYTGQAPHPPPHEVVAGGDSDLARS
jgi:hypothetical protein